VETTIDYFRWLWNYLRKYKLWLAGAFLSMFTFSATNGMVLWFMREAMRHMRKSFEGSSVQSFSVQIPHLGWLGITGGEWVLLRGTTSEILVNVTLCGSVVLLVLVIAEFLKLAVMDIIALGVSRDVREDLYQHIIKRPLAFFEQRNVGDLISRLSSDISMINSSVTGALKNVIQSPLEILTVGGIAVYLAPLLSLIFFLVVPICGFVIFKVGNRIKKYSRGTQDVFGRLLSQIQQRFSGIKLVKSEVNEDREIDDFIRMNDRHFRKKRRKRVAQASLRSFLHFMVYGAALCLMYVGGHFIMANYMPPEDFVVFLASLIWLYKPIRKLSGVNESIQESRGAAERIESIFQIERPSLIKLESGQKKPVFADSITFNGVRFEYVGSDESVLEDISFSISPGDRLGIVGESGAGKSTLVDLLLRFYDPVRGSITMDGLPLPQYEIEDYRELFGLVTQHTILFDETVAENIRYGRETLEPSQIEQAARDAQAWEFIQGLQDGLSTEIGENGVRLSGCERQRVALARALATEPDVLILDEATSNIDSHSEDLILESIENLTSDITIISISHALSSVQFADRILVLSNQTIEATGSHSELVSESPTYEKLYNLQVDDFETAFS